MSRRPLPLTSCPAVILIASLEKGKRLSGSKWCLLLFLDLFFVGVANISYFPSSETSRYILNRWTQGRKKWTVSLLVNNKYHNSIYFLFAPHTESILRGPSPASPPSRITFWVKQLPCGSGLAFWYTHQTGCEPSIWKACVLYIPAPNFKERC